MVNILWIRTPTTKAVGSELVAKYQPTALVIGDANNRVSTDLGNSLFQAY